MIFKTNRVQIVLDLGQEGSERVAAGHAATVLAEDHFPIGTGGVPALVPAVGDNCTRPAQKEARPSSSTEESWKRTVRNLAKRTLRAL